MKGLSALIGTVAQSCTAWLSRQHPFLARKCQEMAKFEEFCMHLPSVPCTAFASLILAWSIIMKVHSAASIGLRCPSVLLSTVTKISKAKV